MKLIFGLIQAIKYYFKWKALSEKNRIKLTRLGVIKEEADEIERRLLQTIYISNSDEPGSAELLYRLRKHWKRVDGTTANLYTAIHRIHKGSEGSDEGGIFSRGGVRRIHTRGYLSGSNNGQYSDEQDDSTDQEAK